MKIKFIINNYQLGGKLYMTPVDKIISQNKLYKSHTEIIYDGLTENEINFCKKVLSKKGVIINEYVWRKS